MFVHGNPCSRRDWEGLVEAAGALGRAVAFDMPGFGQADKPRDFDYQVASYANFLQGALNELGIERAHLEQWCKEVGWETLLNRAGTTFRKLSEGEKANVDARRAVQLMLAQPSMIKRPVLDVGGGKLLVGFKPELYEAQFSGRTAR